MNLPNRSGKQRTFFVDLADPEKRSAADIALCVAMLTRFQKEI